MLGNVLLLCFFVFFIFGIIGVQLWAGLLRNRCVINLPQTNFTEISFPDVSLTRYYIPEDTSLDYICSQSDASGLHTCQNLPPYTLNGIKCNLTLEEFDRTDNVSCINWNIYYNECRVMHKNPFQGSVSFDNIGFAWVAIFLVISLEGWTDIMYYVQDAHSFWNWIYFVLLIVIGAFFMINLCLVVIATQFAETKRRETERMLQERRHSSEQGGPASSKDGGGDSVYAAIVRFVGHWFRRLKRMGLNRWRTFRSRSSKRKSQKSLMDGNAVDGNAQDALVPDRERDGSVTRRKMNGSVREHEVVHVDDDAFLPNESDTLTVEKARSSRRRRLSTSPRPKKLPQKPTAWSWFREKVRNFVVCDHFTRGILVAILVNTLSMGVEYHQQPELLTVILEYSNYFFTALFAFEMMLKVIADGFFGYISDGFNLFDGGIVVLSVLELIQGGKGGLSVLRTFRLLRILKLVRFMPALRKQLVVMLKTMDNVTVFFGLLVLFIFIFSILGMNLFGCKFCKVEEHPFSSGVKRCERKNFDSLLWALITVFQILTQEDWNMVLFNGMSQTTPWAALYFVALMTFGNYVLFNLLVAILVEGFQESKEEERRQLEDEARRRAADEEAERKRELEMLIAKTTSPAFLRNSDGTARCICGSANLNDVRNHLEHKIPLKLCDYGYESNIPVQRDRFVREGSPFPSSHGSSLKALRSNSVSDQGNLISRRLRFVPHEEAPNDHSDPGGSAVNRFNRHASLMLPATRQPKSPAEPHPSRQRINSWCGLRTVFNPNCPIHGPRALIETYAREKFLKASQELERAIAEEERLAEQRRNTKWRRLLRKTCLYTRSDYALFIFSPKSQLRIKCLQLTQKKWFDYMILCFIGMNCVTLAMERPTIPPDSAERMFLITTGYIFTFIFTVEMTLKVIANGCFLGSGAYFKDGWNVLDGVLVIISLINVIMELFVSGDSPKIFGVIRVLRLLRALRPLRVINRAPGVKLVVMTLISSLKPIGNIVLICCTFFIIFGILGVQLFKGMMYHCVGPDIGNITSKAECLHDPRNKWVNHRYNFDNLGQALMSLFVLSSKDGWVSIMYQGIDAVGVDMQPQENYNEWRMIYFISFLLLVGFFVLNMFVGVVVENFHKCKEALEAEMKEKARQKRLQSFGMAFLTLFRIATGDNWNGIMKDALRDDCDPSDHCQTNCCVDPILAPCFFVVFVLISQFVLVNVVVAVLMKHLEESNKRDEAAEAASREKVNVATAELTNLTDNDEEEDEGNRPDPVIAEIERELLEVEAELVDEEAGTELTANPTTKGHKEANHSSSYHGYEQRSAHLPTEMQRSLEPNNGVMRNGKQ
ncbi:Protein CCA-1 a [Aphelenchoides avenae]|nr:Protein CCA-1 a [Aphelenchus avenae]